MATKNPQPGEMFGTESEISDVKTDTTDISDDIFETESELENLTLQLQAEFLKILNESKVDETNFKPLSGDVCEQIVEEEKVVLTSIYETVNYISEDNRTFEVTLEFGDSRIHKEDELSMTFQLPPDYPNSIPIFEINNSESQILSFSDTDSLYDELLHSAFDQRGGPMIYNLLQTAHDSYEKIILSKKDKLLDRSLYDQAVGNDPTLVKENINSQTSKRSTLENTQLPNKKSVEDDEIKPSKFISLHKIIEQCKECGYKVDGVENILRSDLAARFIKTQNMIDSLGKRKRYACNFSNKLEIVYHGTASNNLPSIVSKGLLMPGTENVQVVNGSAYGVGIYVGTNPSISLGYSSASKLLVCAIIPGFKSTSLAYAKEENKFQIYDGGTFYVVRHPSQLLPCYVISLIRNEMQVNELATLSAAMKTTTNTLSITSEEQNKRDKQELLQARMRKFLPFGFGPGEKTVVLEAGDWDDDDDAIVEGRTQDDNIIIDYGLVQKETTELQHYRYVYNNSTELAQSKSRHSDDD